MTSAAPPHLTTLAAHWHMISKAVIAFAYKFSRLNQAGARGAEKRAEAFELQIRCTLIVLARQINAIDAGNVQSTEDTHALEHLHVLRAALTAVAMVVAKMRAELAGHSKETAGWGEAGFDLRDVRPSCDAMAAHACSILALCRITRGDILIVVNRARRPPRRRPGSSPSVSEVDALVPGSLRVRDDKNNKPIPQTKITPLPPQMETKVLAVGLVGCALACQRTSMEVIIENWVLIVSLLGAGLFAGLAAACLA